MKRITITILAILISLPVLARQRSTFSVESNGFYIQRDNPSDLEGAKRFFGIGVNVHGWPNTTENCPRYPSEKEFTSAKEIFNLLHIRYHDGNTSNGCSSIVPSWITTSGHDETVLMSGPSHVAWSLRTRTSVNSNGGVLGPLDQDTLESTLQPGGTDSNLVSTVVNEVKDFSKANQTSDLIFWIQDEPEYGDGNWHFPDSTIIPFKNVANSESLFTYVDLGPVRDTLGNNYLYAKNGNPIPDNNLGDYRDYIDYESTEEFTLTETVKHYKNTSDVIGVNSYYNTSGEPEKLGQYVKWIHDETNNKPVWPWIGTQCGYYGHLDCSGSVEQNYYHNIRAQAFSAIINKTAGMLFWANRSATTDEKWDEVLDVAKELHYYKYIMEYGSDYLHQKSGAYEFLIKKLDDTYFTFFHSFNDNSLSVYYHTSSNPTDKLINTPRNLGFEDSVSATTGLSGNWKIQNGTDTGTEVRINNDPDHVKIGAKSLYLKDNTQTKKTVVQQWFDIIPGYEYQVQGWYKGIEGYQWLVMQFYNENGWLAEYRQQNQYVDPNGPFSWELVKTPVAQASSNATKLRIHIETKLEQWGDPPIPSEGYWDDIMVKIVGDGSSSSKIASQKETIADTPDNFNLSNYPNPFNPTTTISYDLPSQSDVILKIYNVLGREIQTLVNRKQSAGNHTITFDAQGLSSGVYFYELNIDNKKPIRKKMLLIK